jgi:hypothetical protein
MDNLNSDLHSPGTSVAAIDRLFEKNDLNADLYEDIKGVVHSDNRIRPNKKSKKKKANLAFGMGLSSQKHIA